MNPNCPDPSYPEWDAVAQGCRAAAHAVHYSNPTGWWIAIAAITIAAIIALRWADGR